MKANHEYQISLTAQADSSSGRLWLRLKSSLLFYTIVVNETAKKVLQLMYDSWFKDYVTGFSKLDLINSTGIEENQINQAVGFLESKGLIYSNNPKRYVITTYGIDMYEQRLPLAIQAIKKHERLKNTSDLG